MCSWDWARHIHRLSLQGFYCDKYFDMSYLSLVASLPIPLFPGKSIGQDELSMQPNWGWRWVRTKSKLYIGFGYIQILLKSSVVRHSLCLNSLPNIKFLLSDPGFVISWSDADKLLLSWVVLVYKARDQCGLWFAHPWKLFTDGRGVLQQTSFSLHLRAMHFWTATLVS